MTVVLLVFFSFLGIVGVTIVSVVVRTVTLRRAHRERLKHRPNPTHYVAGASSENNLEDGPWVIPKLEGELSARYPREYRAVDHLCKAISFRTVAESSDQDNECYIPLDNMVQWMREVFPLTFKTLEREDTGEKHSLLLHWHGKHADLLPMLYLAHMDVVVEGNAANWRHDPFAGIIEDESGNVVPDSDRKTATEPCYVYGRGALDCKVNVIAILQAVEILLESGYKPNRDVFIAFGCNEETGGAGPMSEFGASKISATLSQRGLKFICILDEGGLVLTDAMPFIPKPLAAIGVGEKSQVNFRITCKRPGGHSSTPSNPTAPGIIGEIASRIEKSSAGRKAFVAPVERMFNIIGLEAPMKTMMPVFLLNSWLFKPLMLKFFLKTPTSAALVSTVHATTMLSGSEAPNVIPDSASLVANFRLVAGETFEDVLKWVNALIPREYRKYCTIEPFSHSYGNVFSNFSEDNPCWCALKDSIRTISDDAIPIPYYCVGGTDSRWYQELSECTYRFGGQRINTAEMNTMHNNDERMSTQNVVRSVLFHEDFIQRMNLLN